MSPNPATAPIQFSFFVNATVLAVGDGLDASFAGPGLTGVHRLDGAPFDCLEFATGDDGVVYLSLPVPYDLEESAND